MNHVGAVQPSKGDKDVFIFVLMIHIKIMKKNLIKLTIRKIVLATAFTPFIQIYRSIYLIVIFFVIRLFKRYSAIKAVYLTRGAAKGEILPLVSDIDFVVITDSMDEEKSKELFNAYGKIAKTTKLVDYNFEIYHENTLAQFQNIPKFQYRFMEGKKTWRLLYGKDYLADLPCLPVNKIWSGAYRELKVWWSAFAMNFFHVTKYKREVVDRNYICYKTVSEILLMNQCLNYNVLTFKRSEALSLAKPYLSQEEKILVEKLETIAKKRFCLDGHTIVEDTKGFILGFLNGFFDGFKTHPLSRSLKDVPQSVDCSDFERFRSVRERSHVNRLVEFVKDRWSQVYRGAYLVSSVNFKFLDDMALFLEVSPELLPTSREIEELNLLHWQVQPGLTSQIYLFLLLPNAAFQICGFPPKEIVRSVRHVDRRLRQWLRRNPLLLNDQSRRKEIIYNYILSPFCSPDLFTVLGNPEFTLDGGGYRSFKAGLWTPLIDQTFLEMKRIYYELIESDNIHKTDSLMFLRIFWKTLQLVIINRSVEKEKMLHPLTLSAIERAMDSESIQLPPRLQYFKEAYQEELQGQTKDVSELIPYAIDYLKGIRT